MGTWDISLLKRVLHWVKQWSFWIAVLFEPCGVSLLSLRGLSRFKRSLFGDRALKTGVCENIITGTMKSSKPTTQGTLETSIRGNVYVLCFLSISESLCVASMKSRCVMWWKQMWWTDMSTNIQTFESKTSRIFGESRPCRRHRHKPHGQNRIRLRHWWLRCASLACCVALVNQLQYVTNAEGRSPNPVALGW